MIDWPYLESPAIATGNSKIVLRLSTGFGVVLSMMATVNVVGFAQFGRIGDIQHQLVRTNWVNADVTHTIAATTSTNAREAMELTIAPEEERFAEIAARIDAKRQAVDAALTTLDRLL